MRSLKSKLSAAIVILAAAVIVLICWVVQLKRDEHLYTAVTIYNKLYHYEQLYNKKAKEDTEVPQAALTSAPISASDAKEFITCYEAHAGKTDLHNIWIDDTTILHFAYQMLIHCEDDSADGVRMYMERYDKPVELKDGRKFKDGDISEAIFMTQQLNGMHCDWYSDSTAKNGQKFMNGKLVNDAPLIDNYNHPCPVDTPNCGSL